MGGEKDREASGNDLGSDFNQGTRGHFMATLARCAPGRCAVTPVRSAAPVMGYI